jgi:outer membrane protein assembly factor BamB
MAAILGACNSGVNLSMSAASSNVQHGEWPMEGFSPTRSRVTNESLTLPLRALSEYTINDPVEQSSPVAVSGGLLFVEGVHKLYALALEDGVVRWQFPFVGAFFSPAVVEGVVYVRSETGEEGYVFALRADTGAKLWQYKFAKVGSTYDNIGGHVTSPVVVDGLVLVGAAQTLQALDAQSGKERWSYTSEFPIVSSAAVADETVYFADFMRLYAIDLANGRERWRFDHGKLSLYFAPILVDDQVALSGDDTIYMLERTTGALLWSREFANSVVIPAGASEQHLYVKSTNQLWALNRQDGVVAWNYATTNFVSLPAITLDHLYIITRSGGGSQVRALQQSDGAVLWQSNASELTNAAPAVAGGRVYVRAINGNVVVFSTS